MPEKTSSPIHDNTDTPFKYRAFISYSHQDRAWGNWLHKKLETYKPPRKLKQKDGGERPGRIFPVFRDREELPTSADLGEVINQALKDSEYLVVICSPRSAQSIWVNEEIKHFKALGREDKVLALIVDGEPNGSDKSGMEELECFPKAMRYRVDANGKYVEERTEAVAGDVRDVGDGKKNAFLKLVAGLLNVDYARLNDREQKRRTQRIVSLAVAATLLVALILGGWMYQEWRRAQALAEEQARTLAAYEEAEAQRQEAEEQRTEARQQAEEAHHQFGVALLEKAMSLEEKGYPMEALFLAGRAVGFSAVADGEAQAEAPFIREGGAEYSEALALIYRNAGVLESISPVRAGQHRGGVTEIQWSPGGTVFASGGNDGSVRIWDKASGEMLLSLAAHEGSVRALCWSPQGDMVASGGEDSEARIWDARSGEEVGGFTGHDATISGIQWSDDGTFIISADVSGKILLWEPLSGEVLAKFSCPEGIGNIALSPDGLWFATVSGCVGQQLRIWDRSTGEVEHSIYTLEGVRVSGDGIGFAGLAWSPDSRFVATSGLDGNLLIWDVEDGSLYQEMQDREYGPPPYTTYSISWSPDGARIVSSGDAEFILVWDFIENRMVDELYWHNGFVGDVSWAHDGSSIVSGGDDGCLCLWDAQSLSPIFPDYPVSKEVFHADFSYDGKYYVCVGESGITIYDVLTWDVVCNKEMTFSNRCSMSWGGGGARLYVCDDNGSYISIDMNGFVVIDHGYEEDTSFIAFEEINGSALLVYDAWGQGLVFREASTGEIVQTLPDEYSEIRSLAVNPRRDLVAVGCGQGTVMVWKISTGEVIQRFDPVIEQYSFDLAWSNDGAYLASANWDHTIYVWNIASGELEARLEGHEDYVLGVSFSSDDRFIATAGKDGTVKIWAAREWNLVATLSGHVGPVSDVCWNDAGSLVLSAGWDGTVRLWNVWSLCSPYCLDVDLLWSHIFISQDNEQIAIGPPFSFYSALTGESEERPDDESLFPYISFDDNEFNIETLHFDGSRYHQYVPGISSDGGLYSSGGNGEFRIYSSSTRELVRTIQTPEDDSNEIYWSPVDRRIASSNTWSSIARIWDADSGVQLVELVGHEDSVVSIAWSPDGGRIATGGYDDTIRIWDAESGLLLQTLYGHLDAVSSIDWSADGSRVASLSSDKTVRIWPVPQYPIGKFGPDILRLVQFKGLDVEFVFPQGDMGQAFSIGHVQ